MWSNLNPPPLMHSTNMPVWATGIAILDIEHGRSVNVDKNPYYWVSCNSYKKVTSKHEYHTMTKYDFDRFKLIDGHWFEPLGNYLSYRLGNCPELIETTRLEF